jgi:hypothetical protein
MCFDVTKIHLAGNCDDAMFLEIEKLEEENVARTPALT